jgi:hypothetical protein
MKTILILSFMLYSLLMLGQKINIQLDVVCESIKLDIKDDQIKVYIIKKADTVKLLTSHNGFYLDDTLKAKIKHFIIFAGGYKFDFKETLITYNTLLPKWIIELYNKPFNSKNKYLLKHNNPETKSIYTLSNGTGSLFTSYNKFKFKKIT